MLCYGRHSCYWQTLFLVGCVLVVFVKWSRKCLQWISDRKLCSSRQTRVDIPSTLVDAVVTQTSAINSPWNLPASRIFARSVQYSMSVYWEVRFFGCVHKPTIKNEILPTHWVSDWSAARWPGVLIVNAFKIHCFGRVSWNLSFWPWVAAQVSQKECEFFYGLSSI